MFSALRYHVKFKSTGRELSADLKLDKGFWAITGGNESGKSMIFEMMRFALFGSAALRGKTEEYEKLSVECGFSVRGVDYVMERTLRKASLSRGGEVIATSTSVVNAKMVEILGYGLKVFDIANSVNQGEMERLGSMKPTERRHLVDTVVGLDALDNVAKWAKDEARILKSEIDFKQQSNHEPMVPETPPGYQPSETLKALLDKLTGQHREFLAAEAFMKVPGPTRRDLPVCDIALPADNLAELASDNRKMRADLDQLSAQANALSMPVPTHTIEQLDLIEADFPRYEAWQEAQRWLERNKKPSLDHRQYWEAIQYWAAKDELDHLLEKGHVCEECNHVTPPDPGRAAALREILEEFPQEPERSPITRTQYDAAERVYNNFDHDKFASMSKMHPVDPPSLSRSDIVKQRLAHDQAVRRQDLKVKLAELSQRISERPDYETMYRKRREYEQDLARAQAENEKYMLWEQDYARNLAVFETFKDVGERLGTVQIQLRAAELFEQEATRYDREHEAYLERVEEIKELQVKCDNHLKAVKALAILRGLVKQHLMPSLNKVSSQLIAMMTGGQRRSIVVDEDFDVMVDGQPLHSLSGSGKSVANLSLRIGLAQVLTNRTFSVLLADEIDAAMDEFRAEQTANVLRMLVNTISQVLLVSHKAVEAEKRISLGAIDDGYDPADL